MNNGSFVQGRYFVPSSEHLEKGIIYEAFDMVQRNKNGSPRKVLIKVQDNGTAVEVEKVNTSSNILSYDLVIVPNLKANDRFDKGAMIIISKDDKAIIRMYQSSGARDKDNKPYTQEQQIKLGLATVVFYSLDDMTSENGIIRLVPHAFSMQDKLTINEHLKTLLEKGYHTTW